MTVLRHALSGMKVCGTTSCCSLDTHPPDILDPRQRRWMVLGGREPWLVYGIERLYLDCGVTPHTAFNRRAYSDRGLPRRWPDFVLERHSCRRRNIGVGRRNPISVLSESPNARKATGSRKNTLPLLGKYSFMRV